MKEALRKLGLLSLILRFTEEREYIHQIWCIIFIKDANICHLGNNILTLLPLTKFLINLN